MYSQQLGRNLALATGALAAGELAARDYERRQLLLGRHQPQRPEGGSALVRVLQQRLREAARPEPIPLLLEADKTNNNSSASKARSTAAFLLGPRPPAGCDARREEQYHAVPLPTTDAAHTAEIVARFKGYVGARDLETVCAFKKEKNGVKIYTVKEGRIPDPKNSGTGLPVARVGEAVIQAPIEQVAALWWYFNSRADWDKANTLASEVVEEYGANARLVYIKGAAKPMISPRDFVFVSHKVPAGDVGGAFGAQAYVQTNAAAAVPDNAGAVRGNINSVIFFESVVGGTRVRYVCEVEPKGWLPTVAVEAAADDLPGVLGVMKQHLEAQNSEADAQSVVERMESLKEKDHTHPLLTDSVLASREDLEALLKLLKTKLDEAKRDERKLGISLAELKAKIQSDIKKTEARLRSAKR